MLSVLGIAVGGLIGFLSGVFAGPLREVLFKARLQLTFSAAEDCISKTSETTLIVADDPETASSRQAIYLRVRVTNKKRKIAKSCIAYLTSIEKDDGEGKFEPTIYSDSIQLAWSCRGPTAYSEIDIPYGVSQYIDVLKTHDEQNYVFPQWQFTPNRYLPLLSKFGRYRLTVQVSGDGVDPATVKLIFLWKGHWDTFEAHPA